jgi:hypothetical protein
MLTNLPNKSNLFKTIGEVCMKGSYAKQVYLLFRWIGEIMILDSYKAKSNLCNVYACWEE